MSDLEKDVRPDETFASPRGNLEVVVVGDDLRMSEHDNGVRFRGTSADSSESPRTYRVPADLEEK